MAIFSFLIWFFSLKLILKHGTRNKSLLTFALINLSAAGESWTSRSDEWAETARPNMSALYIYTNYRVKLGAAPTASLEHSHNFIMNISEPLIEPAIIHSAHAPPSPSMHLKCRTTRPALSVTSIFFKAEEACSGVCVCKWVCYCLLSKSVQLMTIWARGEREEQRRRDGGMEVKQSRGRVWSGGKQAEGRRAVWGRGGSRDSSHSSPFPPRRTLGFFLLKSLFLCCSYFHRRSRASCVCLITSSSPRRVDLDGDEDNISSVFIHNYDGTVVGLIPTQRCDELFNTQHFREFSRTHSSLSTLLSTEVSAERREIFLWITVQWNSL